MQSWYLPSKGKEEAYHFCGIPSLMQEITIQTHLGPLCIAIHRSSNNLKSQIAPIICIPGASSAKVREWEIVGNHLCKHDYNVCIINLFSNPKTTPGLLWGGILIDDLARIIFHNILQEIFQTEKLILCGKSWGGLKTLEIASQFHAQIDKLLFIAPGFTTDLVKVVGSCGIPTFLAWAKDDWLSWYSNSDIWVKEFGSKLTLYTAQTGGHSILPEYCDPIEIFLQQNFNSESRS